MTLETPRLLLRPFREDDVQAVYDYSAEPEVGLNAGWKPHESLTESRDILHLMFLDQPTAASWAPSVLSGTARASTARRSRSAMPSARRTGAGDT